MNSAKGRGQSAAPLFFCFDSVARGEVGVQRGIVAVRDGREVHAALVDEAIGEQEDLDAQLARGKVLRRVVADHQAFGRLHAELVEDLAIVGGIRLAEGRVLVGGIEREVGRLKPRPADTALRCDGGEDRIRRKGDAKAARLERAHGLRRAGRIAAGGACAGKLVGVEVGKDRLVRAGTRAEAGGERIPEGGLVRARAVVGDHGGRTRPDAVDQRLRLVAERRELRGEQLEIRLCEGVLIHREQCPVKVE